MAASIRDASFYLKRIKDLPSALKENMRKLSAEVSSHRMVITSIQGISERLKLEYTRESFSKDCLKNYATIKQFLENFNLDLVPCSIPVDLDFSSDIFVTLKANLANDEDVSAVQGILESGRAPQQKDMIHISRMNNKMANYNIMLRVFESMFVISPGALSSLQKQCINNMLNELVLPIEGLNYLRQCFTFAGTYRNYRCDFSNPKYCYKRLDAEQQTRVNYYLALIASSTNYYQPFNSSYPFIQELNRFFIKIAHRKPENKTTEEILQEQEKYLMANVKNISAGKERRGFLLLEKSINTDLRSYLSALHDYKKPDKHVKVQEIANVLKNHLKLAENLKYESLKSNLLSITQSGIAAIPDPEKIQFKQFGQDSEFREDSFVFATSDPIMQRAYPFMLFLEEDSQSVEDALKTEGHNAQIRNVLLKKPQLDEERQEILAWSCFFALIIWPLYKKISGIEQERCLKELNLLIKLTDSKDLTYIKASCFTLHENSSLHKIDDSIRLCLFNHPNLLSAALCQILQRSGSTPISWDDSAKELLFLYVVRAFAENSAKNYAEELKNPNSAKAINYAIELLKEEFESHSSLFENLVVPVNHDLSSSLLYSDNSNFIKAVTTHCFIKPAFSAFLNPVQFISVSKLSYEPKKFSHQNKEFAVLYKNQDVLAYLSELKEDEHPVMEKILTQKLSGLEAQLIKRKLRNLNFSSYSELYKVFEINKTSHADKCIELALLNCRLSVIPMDATLPDEARLMLKRHSIVDINIDRQQLTESLLDQLGAAQLTVMVVQSIAPQLDFSVKLASYMDLSPEQHVFVLSYLRNLHYAVAGQCNFSSRFYMSLYAYYHMRAGYRLFENYLKMLSRDTIKTTSYSPFVLSRFKNLFEMLHIRVDELTVKQNVETKHKRSSFVNLDQDLIKSKLDESRELQDTIALIKEEEEAQAKVQVPAAEITDVKTSANKTNAAAAQVLPDTDENKSGSKEPDKKPSGNDNVSALIRDLYTAHQDFMSLDEFSGLCMRYRFMSADAAVEEINEISFENYDEGVFEAVPEEGVIYITLDILEKMAAKN